MEEAFDYYWAFFPMVMDPELEAALKKCETREERNEKMQEYVFQNLKLSFIAYVIMFVVAISIGVISYLCK